MESKDKELQIQLVKLEADAKAYRFLSFSAAGFFGLLVISFLILSINANSSFRTNSLFGLSVSVILGFGFTVFFVIKMRVKRKEIEELKRRNAGLKT